MTDLDGRCSTLLNAEHVLSVGTYKVHFDTKVYFDALGVKGFYPFANSSVTTHHSAFTRCLDHHGLCKSNLVQHGRNRQSVFCGTSDWPPFSIKELLQCREVSYNPQFRLVRTFSRESSTTMDIL